MKREIKYAGLFMALLLFFAIGCKNNQATENTSILPGVMEINIPSSINSAEQEKSALADTVKGSQLYNYMRYFIHIGAVAANTVQRIIDNIRKFNINQPMNFSYTSEMDGRVKNVKVQANQTFGTQTFQFCMTITDAQKEHNPDGGVAAKIYWNRQPVEGIAIIKVANLDCKYDSLFAGTMYRVDYTENPSQTDGYDAKMTVYITGLPCDSVHRFSVRNLKMVVLRKDNIVDVYGNSEHPYAWILLPRQRNGIDWAFVASADAQGNIAAVEVGLPPSYLNSSERSVLLGQYSLYNVLFDEVYNYVKERFGITPDSTWVAGLLNDAKSPAFFNSQGFKVAGTAPDSHYQMLVSNLNSLCPFNPEQIHSMRITFEAETSATK